ncbi:MAG TPA: ATP-binding protein [Ktedonobacteraceae bacterium]|nr:ATP-binding protein [Ktedonobacteraceae bacterium]
MFRMRSILMQKIGTEEWWKHYLIDIILAFVVGLLLTCLILALPLHLRLATILLVYLFIVLYLVYKRGFRTAILAAFIGCATLDFLIVPPVLSITVSHVEDGWELLIFLLFAITLSYSYSHLRNRMEKVKRQKAEESILYEEQLRKQKEEVNRRDRQMSIFYEVMQATRDQNDLRSQLDFIAHTIEDTFCTCGVLSCSFLLPNLDNQRFLDMLVRKNSSAGDLSSNEEASVMWVMQHAESVVISDVPLISHQKGSYLRRVVGNNTTSDREIYHRNFLVPLISGRRVLGESGEKVLGVLHILIEDIDHPELTVIKKCLDLSSQSPATQSELFPKLIDHAVFLIEQALIDRALMQQEALNRELQKRTEELHTAIISSVSHDFHSPLTLIKGAATSLYSQGLHSYSEAVYHQTLEDIVSEANWLERIVMRMLDLSRIEQGALKLEKELYPIEEIILYTLDLGHMRSLIQGRDIKKDIPEDLPPVELDPILIGQVLVNLIENAIRYTPKESPIEIRVRANKAELCISVNDHGPGIPPLELNHIFESFYRGKQGINGCEVTSPNGGSGLGLAVCKGFIEAHGGRIWAENQDGGGARLQFTLPLHLEKG